MIVPMIPKKATIAKFSKNNDFLKLYPAEKIIGGNIIVKNISSLKTISCPRVYFAIAAVMIPIKIAIDD